MTTASESSWRWPRAPSPVLVIDTNIILSVVLGQRSRTVFEHVLSSRNVAASARSAEEVLHVLRDLKGLRENVIDEAEALLAGLVVVEASRYDGSLDEAAVILRHAVASRNGSTADAHVLACAWLLDADIWSHDRDFAGTGWPSWSNANLRRSLDAP
ncbi:PIN domain-containing protein [uncultured Methylobacterium sp.]|uniref:PIN domain-containing protein n=1 Tax=uncultured Methylobacterium sp. TaxID=157278 RepID=UPI0026207DE7|nr:PIN domain-containing protein [uncultured Methylobacterium sp.]